MQPPAIPAVCATVFKLAMTPGNIQDLKLLEHILTTGIRFHIMNFYHLLSVTGPMHALASEE